MKSVGAVGLGLERQPSSGESLVTSSALTPKQWSQRQGSPNAPLTPKQRFQHPSDDEDSEGVSPQITTRDASRSGTPGTSRQNGSGELKRAPSFKLVRQPSNKALLMSQAGLSPSTPKRVSTPVTETMNSPGTGSILHGYVGEVLDTSNTAILGRQKNQAAIDYTDLTFDEQVALAMSNDVPYVSKAKKLKSFWPIHSSERRYRIIDLGKRLKRNDGGLIRIRLSSESIDDDLLHVLCENLYTNTLVQHIMLNNNKITDNGVKKLVKALKRHPAIHTLWLGGNLISDRGVLYLCELCRHNRRLKELNLSNKWPELRWESTEHSDHPRITADGAALLAELLSTPSAHGGTLHNISLNQQRITDRGAILLFRAIPVSHLRTLSISDNQLTDHCCSALKDLLLSPHANLEYLNLSRNRLTDLGIRLIAPSLQVNRILAACDLSYNQITQVGFDLLLDALYSNTAMRTLSLHNNLSDDTSIEVFLKNRVLNTVRSHLEHTNDDNSSLLNQFMNSEGFVKIDEGDDDIHSIDSFGSTPKARPLSSYFGSNYVPKIIRDRIIEETDPHALEHLESEESNKIEECKRFGHHVVASKIISDSSSNIGAFGKNLPSRAPRDGSPMPTNPFQQSPTKSGREGNKKEMLPQMRLSRCASSDLHLQSEESLLACSLDGSEGSLRAESREIEGFDHSKEPARASQKLVLYRSLSSRSSYDHGDDFLPNTATLSAKLISKQDSFEFESDESTGDEKSQYLVLKQPEESAHFPLVSKKYRPSHELGKITGVPYLASFAGAKPIRSATQRHRDSCNHLMYLQVLTPADPPGSQPYPVVMIGADHTATLNRIKEYKQTPAYKQKKRNALLYNKVPLLKESIEALPPTTFWSEWSRQVYAKYPDGIDKTVGCQSVPTLLEKDDPKLRERNLQQTRRKQMAAQVDNLIEKHKEKRVVKATERRKESVKPAADLPSAPLTSPLPPPRTQIAEKYAGETSLVGVGEMYRRNLVNVTATVDKKRLLRNEINTENLLGLKVNEKIADVVIAPPCAPSAATVNYTILPV